MATATGPLAGTTVLDLSTVGPATRCSRLLADYGARVIKVGAPPRAGTTPLVPPIHAYSGQRGMQRAEIDLKAPAGAHAGPSVRRMARELGVDLSQITASGPKGRITKDDLLSFLKGPAQPAAAAPAAAQGSGIPEIPAQDFSKFGPVESQALPRIKKVSGPFLHLCRCGNNIHPRRLRLRLHTCSQQRDQSESLHRSL